MRFDSGFRDILNKRNMTLAQLAARANVDLTQLKRAAEGKFEISDEELSGIAAALGVPERALFATAPLPLSSIPDFRKANPRPSLMHDSVIKAIGFVEKISLSLASLDLDLSLNPSVGTYTGPLTKKAAQELAEVWRNKWGLRIDEQLEWGQASRVYASLRKYIENLGIFVLHHSFGIDDVAGLYAKVDGGPHTILINTTRSSKARKLFTLAHEFCHVLLREDGVSNPSILKNNVETFCNQFAAYLLAPDELVKLGLDRYRYRVSLEGESIRLLAKNLGISQQSCVLRLIELNYLRPEDYSRWMSRFDGPVPLGDQSDPGGGGGGSDPIKSKQTQFGYSFLAKLALAHRQGLLDKIEIFRLAGIKPKYQRALFGG